MHTNSEIRLLTSIYKALMLTTGVRLKQLNWKCAINNDLHVYGDDVDEFLKEINEEYPFEWQTLPFSHYFADEGASIWHGAGFIMRILTLPLLLVLWGIARRGNRLPYERFLCWLDEIGNPRKRTPFTVGLLFAFVKNKTWSDNLSIPKEIESWDALALDHLKKE